MSNLNLTTFFFACSLHFFSLPSLPFVVEAWEKPRQPQSDQTVARHMRNVQHLGAASRVSDKKQTYFARVQLPLVYPLFMTAFHNFLLASMQCIPCK